MFYGLLLFLFIVCCLSLVGIVLLQSSKSGGMGTAMGGAAVQAAFGGQGADKLLTRLTVGLAAGFMILAIVINLVGSPSAVGGANQSIISSKAQTQNTELAAPLDFAPDAAPEEAPAEVPETE